RSAEETPVRPRQKFRPEEGPLGMGKSALDVEIVGKGRGLVLLHSLLSDRTSYEPLAARIAGERRLVLLNLPGFGASPPAGAALADYADAVAQVFDDLA